MCRETRTIRVECIVSIRSLDRGDERITSPNLHITLLRVTGTRLTENRFDISGARSIAELHFRRHVQCGTRGDTTIWKREDGTNGFALRVAGEVLRQRSDGDCYMEHKT